MLRLLGASDALILRPPHARPPPPAPIVPDRPPGQRWGR